MGKIVDTSLNNDYLRLNLKILSNEKNTRSGNWIGIDDRL